MRKTIALALALILLCGLTGCAQTNSAVPAAAEPEPTIEPIPEGMEKVFGKDIMIAYDAPEDGLFARGVCEQALRVGIPVKFVSNTEEMENCDALIHYQNTEVDTASISIPYVALISNGENDEKAAGLIAYEKENEIAAALETMFAYPSHEAPVRILGLFSGGTSEAAVGYDEMEKAGKLQSKGIYVESDGIAAESWLAETLPGIGVGVLDTIFAETPELAEQGFSALKKAARNDAVEICAAGLTDMQLDAMLEDHFLMGSAVGLDEYNAGMLALRMCAGILAGEDVETPISIEPFAVCSDDVRALQKQEITDPCEILERLNTQMAGKCDFDFLTELSEYYKS